MEVLIRSARSLKRIFRFHKAGGKKFKPPEKPLSLEFLWQSACALLS
jgi:hypothetical protein